MKQERIILLLISLIIIQTTFEGRPKALGYFDTPFKKTSQLATALILKRLGATRNLKTLNKKIKTGCVHLNYLGRKLYRKYKVNKKNTKNNKSKSKLAINFVKFILNRLLVCKVVKKSSVAFKLRAALKGASKIGKNKNLVKLAFNLIKSFRGPRISLKKKGKKRSC